MTTAKKKTRRVELVLIAAVIVWGINTPVMKIGLMAMDPLVYNTLRLVIAALLAAAALLYSGSYRPMTAADLRQVAAISLFGFFANQVFIVYGMKATTAGNAALVLATLPVQVALLNRVLRIEPLSGRVALGIVVSLAGIILTVLGAGRELSLTGPHVLGALLILLGQCGYAYYSVNFHKLVAGYSLYQTITCVFAISAALFVLISVPALVRLDWAAVPAAGWYSVAYSAVFALALANFAWVWAIKAIGSTRVAIYPNLSPIVSILFAWLWLDESFGLLQAAGAAIIFLGLWLARGRRQPTIASMRKVG